MKIVELQAWCARLVRDKKDADGNWVHFNNDFFLHAFREAVAYVVARNPESSVVHEEVTVPAYTRIHEVTTSASGLEVATILGVDGWLQDGGFKGFLQPQSKGEVSAKCDPTDASGPTHYYVDEVTKDRVWLNNTSATPFSLMMLLSVYPEVPETAAEFATVDVPLAAVYHQALADYIVARMNGTTARGMSASQMHYGLAKEGVIAEMSGDRLTDPNRRP